MRRPNELWIDPEVFQQLFMNGNEVTWRVIDGPKPEAILESVRMEMRIGHPMIVATYDRDVDEPTLQLVTRT